MPRHDEGRPRLGPSLLVALGWAIVFGAVERTEILLRLGVYAALVAVVLIWIGGARVRKLLTPRSRDIALGLVAGGLMALLTYPAYALGTTLIATLRAEVVQIYQETGVAMASALPALLIIVAVEELLWRGAIFDALRARWSNSKAVAGALLLYVVTLAAGGSWIVLAVALPCGLVWTLLRLWTRGLWTPIVTHAIWSTTIFVLYPLE